MYLKVNRQRGDIIRWSEHNQKRDEIDVSHDSSFWRWHVTVNEEGSDRRQNSEDVERACASQEFCLKLYLTYPEQTFVGCHRQLRKSCLIYIPALVVSSYCSFTLVGHLVESLRSKVAKDSGSSK